MAATALILFDQAGPGTAGEAFEGTVAAGAVTVTNDDNTDVQSWSIDLLDVPPGSALVPGNLGTAANSSTPSAGFTPDVPGTYRVKLDVYDATGLTGVRDRDIRCFGIRNARGVIIPPYQKLPDPLPVTGSGKPGEKPDEQNYSGQGRGWAGDRSSGQLEEFFLTYDDLPFVTVTTTTYNDAAANAPLAFVDHVSAGGGVTFNLPTTGLRAGFRRRIISLNSGTDTVTVTPPGGHNIDGFSTIIMLPGMSGTFLYLGGTDWTLMNSSTDRYERSVVASTESTDTVGFTAIGSAVITPEEFPNTNSTTWQAVIETTNAADAAEIRLFNVTTASVVAGSTLSTTSLTPVVVSASITLASGANIYEAQLRLQTTGSPNIATCKQAQVIIDWLQP